MTSQDSGGRYPFLPGSTLIQVAVDVAAAVEVADILKDSTMGVQLDIAVGDSAGLIYLILYIVLQKSFVQSRVSASGEDLILQQGAEKDS